MNESTLDSRSAEVQNTPAPGSERSTGRSPIVEPDNQSPQQSRESFSTEMASYRRADDITQQEIDRQTERDANHPPPADSRPKALATDNCNLNVSGLPCSLSQAPEHIGDSRYQRSHAEPNPAFLASNYDPDSTRRYILNGMNSKPESIEQDLQTMTAVSGQPVTAVVNTSGSSFLKNVISSAIGFFAPDAGEFIKEHASGFLGDVVSAAASFISPTLARWMEPEASNEMKTHLLDDFRNGRESIVDVFSQGGSILRATLNGIQNELTPEEWDQFKSGVTVIASGSAAHRFPEGVKVTEYEHSGDLVSSITRPLSGFRDGVLSTFGLLGNTASYQSPDVITLDATPGRKTHDFTSYIENYPRFFLASHRTDEGTLDVKGFSAALAHSIEKGYYSDRFHRKLMEQVLLTNQSEEFEKEFKKYVNEDGRIGNFSVYQPQSLDIASEPDVRTAAAESTAAESKAPFTLAA